MRIAVHAEEREKGALRTAALDAARQAVSALTYIYRDAARSVRQYATGTRLLSACTNTSSDCTTTLQETSPEMLGAALSAASNLSPESCACITKVYRAKYPLLVGPDRVQAVLSMGKLLAMDWKLSVATQSSHCAKINAPVVILRFRVADNCGQVTSHSAELTVAEFEDFAGKVSEMSAVMETL